MINYYDNAFFSTENGDVLPLHMYFIPYDGQSCPMHVQKHKTLRVTRVYLCLCCRRSSFCGRPSQLVMAESKMMATDNADRDRTSVWFAICVMVVDVRFCRHNQRRRWWRFLVRTKIAIIEVDKSKLIERFCQAQRSRTNSSGKTFFGIRGSGPIGPWHSWNCCVTFAIF